MTKSDKEPHGILYQINYVVRARVEFQYKSVSAPKSLDVSCMCVHVSASVFDKTMKIVPTNRMSPIQAKLCFVNVQAN